MAEEIERKYLVIGEGWRTGARRHWLRQGYLPTQPGATVRVRVWDDHAYFTIKGPTTGIRRAEYEYPVPLTDANEMLETLCRKPLIEKWRYEVWVNGLKWEVDEFAGDNAGLVLAEVELRHEAQAITLPPWVGPEVSHDARYRNAYLARYPFKTWQR